MAQPTFEQFFSAISEQESGGNYSALGVYVGNDRAYGKYQVMGANIPSWTAKYYGKRLTPQQFLNNPTAQEAVARGVLQSYYNKYGARGAAAAWYSGNASLSESTAPQPGGPSIKGYVDSVISKAYGYPSGGSGSSSKSTSKSSSKAAPAPEEKKMDENERAVEYGYSIDFFNQTKELRDLLSKAQKNDWTKEKFTAEFMSTKYYRSMSGTERTYILSKISDPKTAKQKLDQAYVHVRQLANQMGLRETPENKKKLNTWAYNMAAKGWNDEQLRYDIGKYVYFNDDTWQGEGGETQNELRSYAYSMGVKMSSQWYADKSRNIIRGISNIQDYKDEIRKQAKATFSQWGKQIDAGMTVTDLAQPYLQSMSTILELPSGSLNLFDPTIKKALNFKDSAGKAAAKPIWQFENELRNDSRWKSTQNAQDDIMSVAHQVLSDFGFSY